MTCDGIDGSRSPAEAPEPRNSNRQAASEGWPPGLQFQWTVLVISSMFACVPCLDVYTLYAGCCR